MSGSTGAERIKSREDFDQFVYSYNRLLKGFPGFVSVHTSGSYNSDPHKDSFGDIDLITYIKSDKDKADVKKELQRYLTDLPKDVITEFTSEKYNGKRSLNTGEIITVRYHDKKVGYSAQVDNIIALSKGECNFKKMFLDIPAEKQGLILGLVKIAAIEEDLKSLFSRLGIKAPIKLPDDEEYEFNLSSVELQLRHVKYVPGTFKQDSREVVWSTNNFAYVILLLHDYFLDDSFDDILLHAKKIIKNPRSGKRLNGVFKSMISVKSGEVGTPKGIQKQKAIDKVETIFV